MDNKTILLIAVIGFAAIYMMKQPNLFNAQPGGNAQPNPTGGQTPAGQSSAGQSNNNLFNDITAIIAGVTRGIQTIWPAEVQPKTT